MSFQLKPPLVPPRGEVNAADAFDIGSFDEDDVKGIKLSDGDQEIYAAFNHVNSERWQQEIAGMSEVMHAIPLLLTQCLMYPPLNSVTGLPLL